MQLIINDRPHEVADEPGALLLWVLRDELGMTGTKFGCGAGLCGACTVHVDGVPTRACSTPLAAVAGKAIRTIEGLAADDGTLHPVQQAFIDEQVPQCGWCMSGQIMAAAALLAERPAPDEAEIRSAMAGNICRCGCYVRILRAVQSASTQMSAAGMQTADTSTQAVPA